MYFVLSFHTECVYYPYQLKNNMNFMLSFLLNLSVIPLPAKE